MAVPGGMESRYSCCEGVVGSPGCQVVKVGTFCNRASHGFAVVYGIGSYF